MPPSSVPFPHSNVGCSSKDSFFLPVDKVKRRSALSAQQHILVLYQGSPQPYIASMGAVQTHTSGYSGLLDLWTQRPESPEKILAACVALQQDMPKYRREEPICESNSKHVCVHKWFPSHSYSKYEHLGRLRCVIWEVSALHHQYSSTGMHLWDNWVEWWLWNLTTYAFL